MKKTYSLWLIALFLIMHCQSYSQTLEKNFPRLTLKKTGTTVKISDLTIDVKVIGKMATTTFDFNFHNPESRIYEGEFTFPLGDGQRVSRFAMDVNGKLREAVVVPKQKGQQVFESIVRKNIDPGLLEKTKGNNYKARVYPIPAKGHKRVVIAYEQELNSENQSLLYQLPLFFGKKVGKFKLTVEVFKKKASLNPENSLENFQFSEWNENYKAEFEQNNFKTQKLLSFAVPLPAETPEYYLEEAKHQSGKAFYLNFVPKKESRAKVQPKHITLVWDASFSMRNRNLKKELQLLDVYFKEIGSVKVQLQPFSYKLGESKTFKVNNGNWTELRTAIEGIKHESASDFRKLDFSALKTDEILFFSDGLSTLGTADFNAGNVPVMCINSQTQADYTFLKYVAMKTGGQFLNLTSLTIAQSLDLLTKQPFRFISAEFKDGAFSETYPSVAQTIVSDFSFAGMLKTNKAKLKLNFGFGSKITYSKSIEIDASKVNDSKGLIERMWAYKKLSDLELQSEKNKSAIAELAKDYTIVTADNSLIILDRLEDYLEHRIVPPKELKEEYFKRIEQQVAQQKKNKDQVLERSIAAYKKRIVWWSRQINFDVKEWKERERKAKEADSIARAARQRADSLRGNTDRRRQELNGNGNKDDSRTTTQTIEGVDDITARVILDAAESLQPRAISSNGNREVRNEEKAKKPVGGEKAQIKLAAWDPKTPYIKSLKKKKSEHYELYLSMRKDYSSTPAYFLDVAEFFFAKGEKEKALAILLNVAELDLENHRLLRILARKLLQWGHKELAVLLFEEVLRMRPQEPQSYRDLGLAYERAGKYQQAVDTLYQIAERDWERFHAIVPTAIMEMNAIIGRHKVNTTQMNPKLVKNLPVDVRIVLNWDTDNSDMDLWVTDPIEEKCFYSHKDTRMGGWFPHDHTGGYGPEEFMLKKAANGKYKIQVNYYGTREQGLIGPTTIQLELITNFGTPKQVRKEITLRLDTRQQVLDIGELVFGE